MKPVILHAVAEEAIVAKQWLMAGAAGGVAVNTAAGTGLGVAESFADPAGVPFKTDKVGVVKQGLIKLNAVAATYNWGDLVGLDATGQIIDAAGVTKVGTVAEPATKVLAAPGEVLVYINIA